jgi:hypothetical protein
MAVVCVLVKSKLTTATVEGILTVTNVDCDYKLAEGKRVTTATRTMVIMDIGCLAVFERTIHSILEKD